VVGVWVGVWVGVVVAVAFVVGGVVVVGVAIAIVVTIGVAVAFAVTRCSMSKHVDSLIAHIEEIERACRSLSYTPKSLSDKLKRAADSVKAARAWQQQSGSVQRGLFSEPPKPISVPYVAGSDTSKEAASKQAKGKARRDTMRILEALAVEPRTAKELCACLQLGHETGSARVSEAVNRHGLAYYDKEHRRGGAKVVYLTHKGREMLASEANHERGNDESR
jgi:hypothetical protein